MELNSGRTWGLCTKFKPFPAASSCLMFILSFSVGWLLVDVWLVGWFVACVFGLVLGLLFGCLCVFVCLLVSLCGCLFVYACVCVVSLCVCPCFRLFVPPFA